MSMKVSIVFPAYNEEDNVEKLHELIKTTMQKSGRDFEIIAVENGSNDKTLARLKKLSPLKVVVFPRNYGQTSALDAGIHASSGEVVALLDGDLQNDPRDIPAMLQKLDEGYDAVAGWRKNRQDTFGRRILSQCANWLTRKVLEIELHDYACALKVFRKKFISGIHLYGEMHVFLPAILASRGARLTEMAVSHHARPAGFSKHSFLKAVKDIADLFTVKFMFSYAARPLLFFGGWGAASITLAFVSAGIAVLSTFTEGIHIIDSPYTLLAVMFLILGFILVMMGFLAELMLRIYYEGRKETPYVISEVFENKF